MNYTLFDGQFHQKLKPLTFTRPVSSLRVGFYTIKDKWESFLDEEVGIRTKDYLGLKFNSKSSESYCGICAALLPNEELVEAILDLDNKTIMIHDDKVLAIKPLPDESINLEKSLNDYNKATYLGEYDLLDRPMDIFSLNDKEINNDLKRLANDDLKRTTIGSHNTIIGDHVYIEDGAKVQGAFLNSEDGPIYIAKGAEIMEGSLIRGPFVMHKGSVLKLGTKVYGATTLGPYCKVGGEVNNVVFQGYANKGHDGFLGNSVIGEWCNLGADTNSSNLKNNYGVVKSWDYFSKSYKSTGTQYCGLIMGDHSKSGINTMFNTGSVVGVFANIYDAGFPSKFIPSFSWGGKSGFEKNEFKKAIEVAKTVMGRRNVVLDKKTIEIYKKIHDIIGS